MNEVTHNGISHAQMVAKLVKSPQQLVDENNPFKAAITHAAIGIAGEGGEILDAVKRHAIYDKPFDTPLKPGEQSLRENLIEELGDLEFYMEDLRRRINCSREETLRKNMEKLAKRYGDNFGYSNAKAVARADKELPITGPARPEYQDLPAGDVGT